MLALRKHGIGVALPLAASLGALLLVLLLAAVPAAAEEDAARAADRLTPSERMIARINKARENHGLRPLRIAPKLQRTSERFADYLADTGTFGHGSTYQHAGFGTAGEILALSRGWQRKPWPALGMWLHSDGHRALLLSSHFRYIGASPARGHIGGGRSVVWVVHFGAH